MLGGWQQRWTELDVCVDRLRTTNGGAQRGRGQAALGDARAFLAGSVALGDRAAAVAGVSMEELRRQVAALPGPWIAICRDLAVDAKYGRRTLQHWAGDPNLRFTSLIRYTPPGGRTRRLDFVELAEATVAQWSLFLPTLGLQPLAVESDDAAQRRAPMNIPLRAS